MPSKNQLIYSLSTSFGISAISYWLYKHYRNNIPEKWRRIGILEKINFFPIKSCSPLVLTDDTEFSCEILGLRLDDFRDRSLMIIDENNKMITARVYPKMVLIKTKKIDESTLEISAEGMLQLELNFKTLAEEALAADVHTAVWDTPLDAMLCGEKYDKWFSKYILGKDSGLKLVYYPYNIPVRVVKSRMSTQPNISKQDTGTFADSNSYMLINLSSVMDLSKKVDEAINPLKFRGNFNVKLDKNEAYCEDNWDWIKIGDNAIFRNVAPCTRCIFPNINPVTGERHINGEPMKTLKKYRKWPQFETPVFGIHMGVRQIGSIRKNDVIYVGAENDYSNYLISFNVISYIIIYFLFNNVK